MSTLCDIAAAARTEQGLLVLLDGGHRVCRVLTVASGSATSSVVPVREVLSLALRHDAVALGLAHNHPGGSVEPSAEDLAATQRVREGGKSRQVDVGRREYEAQSKSESPRGSSVQQGRRPGSN